MNKKAITIFPVLIFGLMIASCEKIETQVISVEPDVFSLSMDDIPLQYGRLVSASPVGQYISILWFEQADQTIVGVRINVSRNIISNDVIRIERK